MKKDFIIIILSILALLLIIFLLILPGIELLSLARAGLSFEESRFAEVQAQNQKLIELNKKYQDNPGEVEKLTAALPKEQGLAELLINLENLASASGLIMDSIDFKIIEKKSSVSAPLVGEEQSDIVPKKAQNLPDSAPEAIQPVVQPHKTTEINLKLDGGYDNFKNYLKGIEQNPRLMDLTVFNFSRGQDEGLYSFGLGLNVYYQ